MKALFLLVVLVFTIALAVVMGSRLPVDAVTVIVGVVCGVLASIPTSLLLLTVLGRREQGHPSSMPGQQSYPPVVVVNSPPGAGQMNGGMWQAQMGPWNMAPPPAPRQFRVIGQDNEAIDGGRYSDL